jgi:hypothetical protein
MLIFFFSCCSSWLIILSVWRRGKDRATHSKKTLSKGLKLSKSNKVVRFENVLLISKSGNRFWKKNLDEYQEMEMKKFDIVHIYSWNNRVHNQTVDFVLQNFDESDQLLYEKHFLILNEYDNSIDVNEADMGEYLFLR